MTKFLNEFLEQHKHKEPVSELLYFHRKYNKYLEITNDDRPLEFWDWFNKQDLVLGTKIEEII